MTCRQRPTGEPRTVSSLRCPNSSRRSRLSAKRFVGHTVSSSDCFHFGSVLRLQTLDPNDKIDDQWIVSSFDETVFGHKCPEEWLNVADEDIVVRLIHLYLSWICLRVNRLCECITQCADRYGWTHWTALRIHSGLCLFCR